MSQLQTQKDKNKKKPKNIPIFERWGDDEIHLNDNENKKKSGK